MRCPFLKRQGYCLKGPRCDFLHKNVLPAVCGPKIQQGNHPKPQHHDKSRIPCSFLQRNGFGLKDDRCDFSHLGSNNMFTPISFNQFPFPPDSNYYFPPFRHPMFHPSFPVFQYPYPPHLLCLSTRTHHRQDPQTHIQTPKPIYRIQNLNAEVEKQIPVRIMAHILNLKNVYSTGMFCNKQHNPDNCIVVQNYRKIIDCPSLTKTANNHNHSVNSKLKLAHLNVRSLKNRDNLIQLRQLIYEQQHDILTISESWLNSTVNSEVEIEGYKLLRLDRHHGGGVCVFTHNSLKTKIIKDISVISSTGFHQLWIQIQHKKMKSIVLCVAYRPPDCPVS